MSILDQILESRRRAIKNLIDGCAIKANLSGEPRDFTAALNQHGISVIAEFKRASPSRGVLKEDLDAATQARQYEAGGARALSVLTEPDFFHGSADDLIQARQATNLPVLWKDFILDPIQVARARAMGADAVLLIVRILTDDDLQKLLAETIRLGMTPLTEVFDEADLARALNADARVIGVNHRDLETFSEDPGATARLRPKIPEGVTVVAESAISTRTDVESLERIGVDAVLIGEALIRAADPKAKLRELTDAAE